MSKNNYSIEFWEAVESVVEERCMHPSKTFMTYEELREIVGNRWRQVVDYLDDTEHIANRCLGGMQCKDVDLFESVLQKCRDNINHLRKEESDRRISNQEKLDNIKYGKKAYDLAEKTAKWNKKHLIITGAVAAGQLIQWIILLMQWICTP